MSHFYGQLQGSRGNVTRCGTKNSGIEASVQSWTGSITVNLYEHDGATQACLRVAEGSAFGGRTIWSGPLAELLAGALPRVLEASAA